MYQSTFSLALPNEVSNIFLFENSSSNSPLTVRFEVCRLDYVSNKDSIWKVYLNPIVTSKGTSQTITNIATTINPIGVVYTTPVTTSDGILIRNFVINQSFDYFSLVIPALHLTSKNTILLKRTSLEYNKTVSINLNWREFDSANLI